VPPTDRPTNEILEELLAWTRFAHNRALAEALARALDDGGSFRAYEASNGRSQADVAREAGVSQPTVSRLWAKWRRLGLAREIDGRRVHLASPSDLGLSPPP
jgi:hypothetical protein